MHPTAIVDPGAQLGDDVEVGPFSIISGDVRIGRGTRIMSSVVIGQWTDIGQDNEIWPGAVIGVAPQDLRYNGERAYTKIGSRNIIREYVTIHRAYEAEGVTSLGDDNLIMAYAHVAHNCRLGNQIVIANYVGLAGHVDVEDQAVLGGMCGIHQFVRVGRLAMVGGLAKVIQDVPPFSLVDAQPARIYGMNIRGMQRRGIPREVRHDLKRCYQLLLRSGLNLSQAVEAMRRSVPNNNETEHLIRFLENPSRQGVCIRREGQGINGRALKVEAAGV